MTIDEHTGKMVGQIAKYAAIGTVSLVLGLKAISCTSNHDDNYKTTQNKRKEYQKEREIQKTIRDTTRNEKIVKYVNLVKSNIAHVFTAKSCKPEYHTGPVHHSGSTNAISNYNNKSADNYNTNAADQLKQRDVEIKALKAQRVADSTNLASIAQQSDQYSQQQTNDNNGEYGPGPTGVLIIGMSPGYRDRLPVHFDHNGHATTLPNRYDRAARIGGFRTYR